VDCRPLPSDRRSLEAILAESAVAERMVAARLTHIRGLEAVGRQARNPVFQGSAAQAHLGAELGRLQAALTEPPPPLFLAGPYLTWPDRGMPPADFVKALHQEIVTLHCKATAALAALEQIADVSAPADRDEALRRTIEAIDDGRSEMAISLVRIIAESSGWKIERDELVRVLYKLARQDRRGLDRARPTGAKLVRRTGERLDTLGTPLRIEWTSRTVRLLDRDAGNV
jgi:hypothetical protein